MRILIFYFFIFSSILLSFRKSESGNKNQLEDYNVFLTVLRSKEGTIDLHISRDSVETNFGTLKEELKESKSYIDLFKLFSTATAKIQCGHTQLQASNNVVKEWIFQKNSLPIDYVMVGKKLFTTKTQNETNKSKTKRIATRKPTIQKSIPPDCEIYSIDNRTISEMMKSISKYVSSDENGIDFKYYQVGQLFEFYRNITFTEKLDSIKIRYISRKDTVETYLPSDYPPINSINKRMQEFQKKIDKNSEDKGKFNIQKGKYGYFRFASFVNCRGIAYEEFLEKSFTTLQKKNIHYLIVDLRGNTGGQMQYSFMRYIVGPNVNLGSYYVEKPKKIFENRHIKKRNKFYLNHRILSKIYKHRKRKRPDYNGTVFTGAVDEKLIFKGKIIVITDEATFSAGSYLACNLKTLAKAKIAGQKAGGSFYKGNAGTLRVILPNSKFFLSVNPNTYRTQLEDNIDSQSIKVPDYELEPIYPNLKKKDDWYINKVFRLFKK